MYTCRVEIPAKTGRGSIQRGTHTCEKCISCFDTSYIYCCSYELLLYVCSHGWVTVVFECVCVRERESCTVRVLKRGMLTDCQPIIHPYTCTNLSCRSATASLWFPRLLTSPPLPLSLLSPTSLCQSLHEANPIHCNIIRSLALLFGFSPGAKKAHTGPNWFSCCARFVTVEQKSHCSTANLPPPHLPSHMCTQTHTHTSWCLSGFFF